MSGTRGILWSMARGVVAVLAVAALAGAPRPAAARGADAVSDGVVRIAVLNDRSGIYQALGGPGSEVAARMAVDDIAPLLGDLRVEIIAGDHRNDPGRALELIAGWRAEPGGLDAVVDVPNSAVALAVQDVARETGLVHLNVSAAAPDLTGRACAETGVHWAFDTHALASGTGQALVTAGGRTWFFLTADYVFGHRLEADASAAVAAAGGRVLGTLRHPFAHDDFAAYLLAAKSSGADVIALANAGEDMVAAVRAAAAADLRDDGRRLAGLLVFLSDIKALGLEAAQGLSLTTAWYWDLDAETRAFAARFQERGDGGLPTVAHAGTWSAVRHYLQGVRLAGTDAGPAVVAAMRSLPVDDLFARGGRLRADGRMVHDMYLAEVKAPGDSRGPGDYYRILRTIPGDLAFRPPRPDACPGADG